MPPTTNRTPRPALFACALALAFAAGCSPTRARQDAPANARDTSSSGTASPADNPPGGDAGPARADGPECATNDDCVRASCCHPTACGPRARAPQCDGVMCTQECRGNTLDCGGSCACESGHCVAHFARLPTPPAVH